MSRLLHSVLRAFAALAWVLALAWPWSAAQAHNVGQVQTTKYFAPETVAFLKARALAGTAGFYVGDTVTYIIQFSPVANNATQGANGYVTDYIPAGTEVVAASFVQNTGRDSNGDIIFVDVAPSLPGLMPNGWGADNANTFGASSASFNVGSTYDAVANGGTGRCAQSIYSTTTGAQYNSGGTNFSGANCNGLLSVMYADTGIFYSTDGRTTQNPPLPSRLQQGTAGNGYTLGNMTRGAPLLALLGESTNTVHNLWDACMGRAFGSGNSQTLCNSGSFNYNVSLSTQGSTPYMAGSAVAGPQTGYPLDYTGEVGPWQRIAYSGSRIGNPSSGPATADSRSSAGANENATPLTLGDGGMSTGLGYALSYSNPLPSGTNAVRWAVGKLTVGQISYVKITLRVTAPLSSSGITNGSEVFGGDASDLTSDAGATASSIDNPWAYLVPSVADNNSNLFVNKIPCVYNASATSCTPLSGSTVAPSTTVTYQIIYLNTGNLAQDNVQLFDVLPCESTGTFTAGTATGQITTTNSFPYSTTATSGTNCGTGSATRNTITFANMGTLGPGAGGSLIVNVKNTATGSGDPVSNTALLVSTNVPGGVTANAVTFVGSTATNASPSLSIQKTVSPSSAVSGGTVQYTIVVQNTAVSTLTTITIADVLPSMGGTTANPSTRFNYSSTASIQASGLTVSGVAAPTTLALGSATVSTNTAANFTPALTPYSTLSTNTNSVVVNWHFGNSKLAAGGVITITFSVKIGTSVAASPTPYTNNAIAIGGTTTSPIYRIDTSNVAPVTISSSLGITKTLACYYDSSNACVSPGASGNIPNGSSVSYVVTYANLGVSAISNVGVSDLLPCQLVGSGTTATATLSSQGTIPKASTTYTFTNGNCPNTQSTIVLGTISSLAAGATGSFTLTMKLTTPSNTSTIVSNAATITGTGVVTATYTVQNNVLNQASLQLAKTASATGVVPGSTMSYTITITNVGTTAAQTITVYDWLPTGTSTTADSTRRFSQTGGYVVSGGLSSVGMTTATNSSPTQAPYNSDTYAANQQELVWSFGSQTLGVGQTATIQLTVVVGSNLPTLTVPNYYYNNAKVTYYNNQSAAANAVGVSVSLVANLSVSKTNGTSTIYSGGSTSYTLTVVNGGPSAADGAVLKDPAATGLSCSTVTCAVTGGAVCPASLTIGGLQGSGLTIPTLPANSTATFVVGCTVTATGS